MCLHQYMKENIFVKPFHGVFNLKRHIKWQVWVEVAEKD